jgi:hypothetical protein
MDAAVPDGWAAAASEEEAEQTPDTRLAQQRSSLLLDDDPPPPASGGSGRGRGSAGHGSAGGIKQCKARAQAGGAGAGGACTARSHVLTRRARAASFLQVPGCGAVLDSAVHTRNSVRYRVCDTHMQALSVDFEGQPQRFCQARARCARHAVACDGAARARGGAWLQRACAHVGNRRKKW